MNGLPYIIVRSGFQVSKEREQDPYQFDTSFPQFQTCCNAYQPQSLDKIHRHESTLQQEVSSLDWQMNPGLRLG